MQAGPEEDQGAQPTMKREDLGIGESKRMKHRSAQNQEKNDTATSNRVVAANETNLNLGIKG